MRLNNQILGNLRENKEDWYYLCNDAEQALFKVKNECKDERAIKSIERMILELNNIRMEQYNALTEYALVEEVVAATNLDLDDMPNELRKHFKNVNNKDYIKKSLKMHLDKGLINKDEYKELYKEFISNENTVVKNYEDGHYNREDGAYFKNDKDNDIWVTGWYVKDGKGYYVNAKVYMEPSKYGINNGPVSKLSIYDEKDNIILNYDRNWDVRPTSEYREIYMEILKAVKQFRKENPYE